MAGFDIFTAISQIAGHYNPSQIIAASLTELFAKANAKRYFYGNLKVMDRMKIILAAWTMAITIQQSHCQINMSDSSAQIIGYWSVGDKQSFDVSYEKYQIKDQDTTSRMLVKYEIDVTVKDSTESSYTIEWFYKNYDIDTDNELVRKISKAAEDVSVIIKTDEFGALQEVVNWEEVRAYISKAMEPLRKELEKVPGADKIIDQSMAIYNSKAAIEANAIKDAAQFYTFHGGVYTLNEEVSGQMQFANNFGGEPFDVDVTLSLDELNEEDDNSVIRMHQVVNSEQLTNVTYEYLIKIGTFGEQVPDISTLPELTNEVWTASRIHGGTGWTTYSIETKETKSEGTINIEERIIQIK